MSQSADSTQSLSLTERQRIEASLAHERELLQSLMDSMPDTIYFKDRQSRFVKVNQAFLQRHGLAAVDAVGKTDFDIFGQEHSGQAFADEQRLMATGEAIIGKEEKEDHRDGRVTWVSSTKVPLRDPAGNVSGLVGISRDITERKQAETSLNLALSLQQATIESTTDGLLVVDKAGKIQSFNQRFLELWRIPNTIIAARDDDQAIAFVLDQLTKPEEFQAKIRELYLQPDRESFDLLPFKDGRIFERYSRPQRIGAEIVGRVWSFRDITERHQAESALRRLEERFHKVWDHSAEGMRLTNAAGTVIMVNPAYCMMVGLPKESLEGHPLSMVFAEANREHVLAAYQERFKSLTVKSYAETETVLWNGNKIWVALSNSYLESESGEPLLLGIFRDVSERKQAEIERERLIEELQKALAEVKTLSGIIPICAGCKKIRDDKGFWSQVESYVSKHSKAIFSHSLCPECVKKYYPDLDIKP